MSKSLSRKYEQKLLNNTSLRLSQRGQSKKQWEQQATKENTRQDNKKSTKPTSIPKEKAYHQKNERRLMMTLDHHNYKYIKG